MSIKTMFKRIALVTVSVMGFGLLSAVSPASATSATNLVAAVGPGGQTSLTVVGSDSSTVAALVRLDVVVDSATSDADLGLSAGESITATVVGVPTGVVAKTLATNGGSVADTATVVGSGTPNRGDLKMVEIAASSQTSGTIGATGASTTRYTDWTKINNGSDTTNIESSTVIRANRFAQATDGVLGFGNTFATNMDGTRENNPTRRTASYYVSISGRTGANIIDVGAYTIQFQLTDSNGAVIATRTVKIDFVSTAARSDASLTFFSTGTFIQQAALANTDTSGSTFARVTLANRDGGLIRNGDGSAPQLTSRIQTSTTAAPAWTETGTLIANDSGTADRDSGVAGAGGSGTLRAQDGVYGLTTSALPTLPTIATDSARIYRFNILYGNATPVTSAFTLFAPGGSGSAEANNTDVLVTAAGMRAADRLLIANESDAGYTWTLPTTTTSATVRFTIQTSADTATPGAEITLRPTWSGPHGTASVTPATSTTGTVYTTDASGNFTVTVTNSAPVAGASVALNLSGGAAFGADSYTATLTWAAPVASSIVVADPLSGVYVRTGSTNVTTVLVTDQFGNPVANQSVSVSLGTTSANYSATTTIAPISTGANGTATYSLVGGATTATFDTITFQCVPTACGTAATMTYNYVSTVPAVSSLNGYFNQDWEATAVSGTLWPASGNLYQTGTSTELTIDRNIDTSRSLNSYSDSNTDALVRLALYGLSSTGAAAQGAVVTLTAGDGGHILDTAGLPAKSRNLLVGSTGWTADVRILATKTGDITFTATSGTVSRTFTLKVANDDSDARFINIVGATTGAANGSGVPVTVTVTDRFGNAVSGVALVIRASGVGSLVGGTTSTSFTTDSEGTYTFLATTLVNAGGVGTFTASSSTAADFGSVAGFSGATAIDSTVAAGNASKSLSITFAAGQNAAEAAAEAATDAALEAIDAANAATDAANLAAEAADAATVAAEEARDAADAATAAVEALASEVATLIAGLKAQITTLANTVAKIAKRVRA